MLDTFIQQFGQEFEMQEFITQVEPGHFKLIFEDNVEVEALSLTEGNLAFKGIIGPCPKEKQELFFVKAMEANSFGRGTLGAVIGLNEEANHFTLSNELNASCTYQEWKDKLEDFINILDIWKKEALNHH